MTIDEAIKNREECLKYLEGIGKSACPECVEAVRWSVKALKAMKSENSGESHTIEDHFRDITKMVPIKLDQLRKMDGVPVWIVESPDWGHWELSEDAEDYICDRDIDLYGLTYPDPDGKAGLHKLGWIAYAYHPAYIDREAWGPCDMCETCSNCWMAMNDKYGTPCNKCIDFSEFHPVSYCRYCGRPLTSEAWAELEKRLRW